ncbi:MAG: hypothetical protein GXO36_07040 [Chloroflexi bacterium]|nr:hypothetical protein [Chloroflexota bacterium]
MAYDDDIRSLFDDEPEAFEDDVEAIDEGEEEPEASTASPRLAKLAGLSPQAFFVINMVLFFAVCLLSLLVLLLTGKIVPA